MLTPYLAVGEVLKPQGLLGELKVRPLTDDPTRFESLSQVFLEQGGVYTAVPVESARVREDFVYLRFKDITDRDKAEALRGRLLYVDRAHAVKLEEGAFFLCDLIGCGAYDTEGNRVGTLAEVLQPGGNDVYVFDTPRGRLLVPALTFAIPEIDIEARRVVLDQTRLDEVAVLEE